jgi:iron complex outermembrane recepter protein
MQKFFLTMLCFLSITTLIAQTITGTINDAEGNVPLQGAIVLVKGTINGTITDADGKFTLKATPPQTLQVSLVGYKTQEIAASEGTVTVSLKEDIGSLSEVTVTGNRVAESITKAAVSVEQLGAKQIRQMAAFDVYSALQSLKGVDLLSQSLGFKSVNMRGFGANNNNRFVQLTDGMDNRSPGLGFGFGSAAGVSDLDIESIEILPGASSALYGPDALQGLMLTKTRSPFEYQGLSAQIKAGANNIGKTDIGAKPYTDVAIRYAQQIGDKFAFKVNVQAINGTDFIADNYNDRMTRGRRNFFVTNTADKTVSLGYTPNNDPATNLEYDGVNILGDDVTNSGSFDFPATFAKTALAGKRITRTGYKEVDLTGDNGKVFSYRGNAALHYKITDKIEAIGAVYYGNGNFTRTGGFREYFPDYKRTQYKLEIRSDEFFVRAYNTSQQAEGYNLGVLAQRMLQNWKPTATWATDFANAYTGDITAARAAADIGKPLPGTPAFNTMLDALRSTPNNVKIPGSTTLNGVRLYDNSSMQHYEGMYNFKKILPEMVEVVTGASLRNYQMLTKGTIFPATSTGAEFTIQEIGAYLQGSVLLKIADKVTLKPTAAVRYDKNQYFSGGFTPRLSGVLSIGDHNIRASWQSAFRNPSPNQLLADGKNGEVGGAQSALEAANLYKNPAYTEASAKAYAASGKESDLVKYDLKPENFTTEKIKTWEVGYKTLIGNRLYIDAFYYQSAYKDFIATQNYYQPKNGQVADLKSSSSYTTYQVNFNNYNEIFVNGFGAGAEYAFEGGLNVGFNYANQVGLVTLKDNFGVTRKDGFGVEIVKRKMSNPEVSAVARNFFISPENRYNITLGHPKITKDLGFTVTYRWTDKMWVEQGNTQGDVWLPSWSTIDAAVMYKLPKMKSSIKVGASNLLNQYYSQGYGLARIGGLYYVALTYN